MVGFYKINGWNASRAPFRRTHVTSAAIFNVALLAERGIYFDKRIFICEDLDFNVRLSEAGLVIAKSYRQMLFKVNMRTGGCSAYAFLRTQVPVSEVAPKQVPELEQAHMLRPLCELRADEVREAVSRARACTRPFPLRAGSCMQRKAPMH